MQVRSIPNRLSAAHRLARSLRFTSAALVFVAFALLPLAACNAVITVPVGVTNDSVLVAQDAIWTALVHASAMGGSLKKTGGINQVDDAGAVSEQRLAGDGWMELSASELGTYRCIGLSHGNPGTSCSEINFAFRLQGGVAEVRENGVWKTDTRFAVGDMLRIAVTSNRIVYSKNGAALYTSRATPVWPLLIDTALIDAGATLKNVHLGLPDEAGPVGGGGGGGGGPAADAGALGSPQEGGMAGHDAAVDMSMAPKAAHHRCGWLLVTDPVGKASFLANASWFDVIHPDWYRLNPDGIGVTGIMAPDDPAVLAAAAQNHVAVVPMVASVESVAYTRAMLYTPAHRAAHIQVLVNLAVSHHYAGLDLDYEHLWNKADAAPLAAFISEFAAAMHAAGKQVSMAVPGLDNGGSQSWSYATIAANLDSAHVMGYDFHTIGTHAGPTAPLGWIDRVMAQAQTTGHPERFILGLPNYGVTSTSACTLRECAALCTSAIATSSTHMQSCPSGSDATPERILNCNSNAGELFFDDAASLEQKVARAKAHGFGGITYWNVGNEPVGFFAMVKSYY